MTQVPERTENVSDSTLEPKSYSVKFWGRAESGPNRDVPA